ncbi:MAG TPA: dihydrodipicolinate synthase family protein [Thermomicrobiaceae bacterium]|nr:dihydrodipicolinate synthase family protein [Thermomicrobiaceae bacterium]
MSRPWRGVFTIPCTPFNDDGTLDLDSLRREVAFCIEAGAHGIVAPVNASEFWTLSDDERKAVAEVIVQAADHRVPTVIGVAGGSTLHAVAFARHAQQIGADAVIAMPPYVRVAPLNAIFAYYRALSEAISIPIFIQNHDAPAGTRLSPEFVARLVQELEHVDYVKEETLPPNHAIAAELKLCGPKLKGVMGGIAGRYLMDEYRRGACGTMPACEATDVHVQVWNALDNGEARKARDLFNRLLPLLNFESVIPGVYKAVLKRRGIIRSDYLRSHDGNPLDASDHQELSAIFDDMRDLFRLAPPK